MSFLKRAISQGISKGITKGIGDAVSGAVRKAVEPKATQWANQTADRLDQATRIHTEEVRQSVSGMEGAFANLQRAAESYATEVSKNVKVCPGCGEAVSSEKKFCPGCGAKLPETTMAQDAVCTACGKQNSIGTKFCVACGAKLPAAIAEEEAAQRKMQEALVQWESILPMFPKWSCGGMQLELEAYDPQENSGYIGTASVRFPRGSSGEAPLQQYWEILKANGFRTAGRYPDQTHLYKKIGDTCYMASSEHAFEGGMDYLMLEFAIREPDGGFDYVKPEPKQQVSFKSLKSQLTSGKELGELKEGFKDLKNMFRK